MKRIIGILVVMLVLLPFNTNIIKTESDVLESMTIYPGFQGRKSLNTDMIFTVTRTTATGDEVVLKDYFVSKDELKDSKYTFTNDHFALSEGRYTVDIAFPEYHQDGSINYSKYYIEPSPSHKTFYIEYQDGQLASRGSEVRFYNYPVFFDLNLSGQVSIDDSVVEDIAGIRFTLLNEGTYRAFEDQILENPMVAESIAIKHTRTSRVEGNYTIQDYMFSTQAVEDPIYVVITRLPEGMSEEDMGLDFKWIRTINYNDIINAPNGKRVIARQAIPKLYTQDVNIKVLDEKTLEPVSSTFSISGGHFKPINITEEGFEFNYKLFSGDYNFESIISDKVISRIDFDGLTLDQSFFSLNNLQLSKGSKDLVIYVKSEDTPIEETKPEIKDPEPTFESEKEIGKSTSENHETKTPNTGFEKNSNRYIILTAIGVFTLILFKKRKYSPSNN